MDQHDISMRAFSQENRARCEAAQGFNHPLSSWSLSDWFTAAMGELGEAANIAKKLNRVRDGIPGNTETPDELRANLADEIADTYIYLDLLAQSAEIDLPAAIRSKFDRTSEKIGYRPDRAPNAPQPSRPTRELLEAGLLRGDEPCECGECTVEECDNCMMPDAAPQPSATERRASESDADYLARLMKKAAQDAPQPSEAAEALEPFDPNSPVRQRALAKALPHPDDLAVDRFAQAMKAKLARKRAEGRGGWEDKEQCSAEFLSQLLREHVEKGDPLDVGNLAMMLHQRGETISALTSSKPEQAVPSGWQPIETAPKDGTIIEVAGRYPDATSGFPRYVGWREDLGGGWYEHSRFEPQRIEAWAWRPRTNWPSEAAAPTAGGGDG